MEQLPSLLLLPADLWGCIMSYTGPKDVLCLSCTTLMGCKLTHSRRRGILLARHCARVQLRAVRQHMQARRAFVAAECGGKHLLTRGDCQAQVMEVLQRSPDPIPDLAAAVQQGLALMTTQTSLAQSVAAPMRADLVRCANFVCLLAWRQHMREVRRRAAAEQHPIGPIAGAASGPSMQQPELQQGPVAGTAAAAGGQLLGQPAMQAAAVQTEGTSLKELQELLSGLSGVISPPDNPSLRLSTSSINLLHHLLRQQLQAWNLQPPVQQGPDGADGAGAVAAVAAVEVPLLAAGGDAGVDAAGDGADAEAAAAVQPAADNV